MSPTRVDSRSAILEAALSVFCDNPGASLAVVAERAGVGRATLHRHFGSREALIRDLALLSAREIGAAVEGLEDQSTSASDYLDRMIAAIIPLGSRFHFLGVETGVLADEEVAAVVASQKDQLAELIDALKTEGQLDRSVPSGWAASVLDGLVWAAWSAIATGDLARNEAAEIVQRTFWRGLATPPTDAGRGG